MTANKRRDDPWDVRWERLRAEAEQLPDGKKVRWLLAAIRTMIEKGELRHGEKLPSQAQFKDHYKMSPTTSREAYGRLIGLGRVRTSQGQLRNVYMPTKRRHRLIVRTRESAGHQEPVGQQDSVSEQLRVAASPILPVIAFLPVDGAGPVTARWEDGAYAVPE